MGLNIAVTLASYLLGSVPTAYIAARILRGIDIRQRGSGQVGGSNAWHSVSRKVGAAVVLVDFAKGALCVALARFLGMGLEGQVAAGLAAIVGHNWSFFLRFSGGRGIATMGGVLALLSPAELAVVGAFTAGGLILGMLPVGIVFGVAALPVASRLMGEPNALVVGSTLVFLLLVFKRVVPRRKWPASDRRRVLLYRLLFDRDVRSREAWVRGQAGKCPPDEHRGTESSEARGRKTG
ncbi:MAG: glycerol-3-phosphate acyltransferase [Chloroflexi bacterium]|nr:glycerol-3-phosphate acyltransferase [Chloroflexota bacterium]